MNEIPLNVIRKWPDGFSARLQHVWLDVVSFIPEVKLRDLQSVLAEYGFVMKVYEGEPQPAPSEPTDAILTAMLHAMYGSQYGIPERVDMDRMRDVYRAALAAQGDGR